MADGKVEIEIELTEGSTKQDAEKIGREAGESTVKGAAKSLSKLAAAGVAAGAAAATAITKQAIDAFSTYEQLVGGVQKIFNEMDQAAILNDANNAYIELNMNANEYLAVINQTGAAFAATMGDEAGYNTARKGMLAISDYASGTSRSIDELSEKFALITRSTSSYQSIADQFSGILPATSADFLEQAQAAGILSEEYAKLTEVPMAEYQQAVAEMLSLGVEQMGLAGNTAAESANTISGSLAAATKAWEDWLAVIAGTDYTAVVEATDKLVDAVAIAAANIVPRIGTVLTTLATLLVTQMPIMLDQLLATISANGVNMATAALDFFLQMLFALLQATPQILTALLLMLASLVVAIYQKASEFLSQGVGLMASLAQGIADGASYVVSEIARGIDEGVQRIKDKVDAFFDAGSAIVGGLVDGIRSAIGRVTSAASDLMASVRAYLPFSPAKVGPFSGKGWSLYSGRSIVEALAQGMRDAEGSALASVSGVMGDFQAAISPSVAYAGGVTHSSTATYSFGDIHINASDLAGMRAVEDFLSLIETA